MSPRYSHLNPGPEHRERDIDRFERALRPDPWRIITGHDLGFPALLLQILQDNLNAVLPMGRILFVGISDVCGLGDISCWVGVLL
jgi:hypothetical protein